MWPSFETAPSVYDWANIFLIGALVVGAISTVLVVWMGNVKESQLRRDVAGLETRAAEANEMAEKERLARVKIEEKIAPRTLMQPQQERLTAKVAEFKGQRATIGAWPSNPESELLLRHIAAALSAAGWEINQGPSPFHPLWPGGVMVATTSHPRSIAAGAKLAEALNAEGIFAQSAPTISPVVGQPQLDLSDPASFRVVVVIGAKPE